MSVESKKPREACCSKLKLFLASLAFVYFSKAFGGAYMKSSITQIERRFDIPSSLIGVIDGSFEMGNLLVIAFVSYFGAKLHRPRLIGIGCLVMAAGSFLIAMPHFFQGLYKYETTVFHNTAVNNTESALPCHSNHSLTDADETPDLDTKTACEKAAGSSMWIYVFLGNMLRGIGETPIMPLGVSYLDDFSREENTPFYLACIHTVGILGPMFGFMLGSYLAKIYVDIGSVDLDTITINHKDSRWVGAWWLGFIVTGTVILLSSIPFWFLPKSLPKQGQEESQSKSTELATVAEQENFLPEENQDPGEKEKPVTFQELAKDFIPSLKRLFRNSIFSMMILTYLVAVNGFIGMITFKPKFLEQVYGQSASKAIFLIGILNLPAVALGIITGGFILKRFKLGVIGAARVSITASIGSFCLLFIQGFINCDNAEVGGLTISYQGVPQVSYNPQTLLSQCNMGCSCSLKHWDPICAYNGMTYASPCLAGCQTSTGTGKEMVFHNCTCVGEMMSPGMNMSAVLGQCPRKSACDRVFKIYMALSVVGSFISACGGTPGYIVLLRSIQPDLKALALGMQTLIVRTLGGIPPPIYFGALIDRTCLKWGTKQCGGRGACRLYDANAFRMTFLGLITGLYFLSNMLWGFLYRKIVKKQRKIALRNQAKENGLEGNSQGNGHGSINISKNKDDTDKEKMEEATEDRDKMTSQQALCEPDEKTTKHPGISTLKLFIVALSFACFSKALTGTYMKSCITQIERRFDLSSMHIGLIDGSFEMGNLLFLAVVSHFGAKLHRPRAIAVGCFLMAVGAFLTGLTHFFMGRYKYNTVAQVFQNDSVNVAACVDPLKTDVPEIQIEPSVEDSRACVRESSSNMWIYVFLGNALRGIGETPVTPLGISYIDDFAKAENSPFYIACLQTITLLGPMFGFLLGSYCAKLYVDIGYVDLESVTITPNDARWVGAWWMGFLVSSALLLVSSIPFWFLPSSLPKQEGDKSRQENQDRTEDALHNNHNLKLTDIAKGFLPSLKRLLGTPTYFLLLCGSILKFNSFIGLLTFKAKYMEQQFGQSVSRANFLIGVLNLPVVAVGIFLGGLLMKRYKLSLVSGAQLSFATSLMAYLLQLLQFGTKCDNIPVAGLTISYNGTPGVSYNSYMLFSECNRDCSCSAEEWDPVCSDSGITYISPCMAGCISSSGYGKNTVFHNCSCVSASYPAGSSTSVRLGQCPHAKDCSRSFTSYMAISVLSSFINSLGATPGYMVIIRCIAPELKSLALGMQTLVTRTLAGIPAPVYFGALIDSTCLKWSIKKCGGRGSCRIYDSAMYRVIFLGLLTSLSGSSYFFIIAVIILLRRQFRKPERETETQHTKASKQIELKAPANPTGGQASACKTPKLMPATPKVSVRITSKLEDVGEVHCTEQLPQDGRVISTNNTQEGKQLKSLTETTAEFTPPIEEAKMEMDGQKSEEEVKEGKDDELCKQTNTQVEIEKLDHQMDEKNELEEEMTHSKETDEPQN
ncbi:uncharacterized protein ABDE67_021176 [Symphorus nematophorus]